MTQRKTAAHRALESAERRETDAIAEASRATAAAETAEAAATKAAAEAEAQKAGTGGRKPGVGKEYTAAVERRDNAQREASRLRGEAAQANERATRATQEATRARGEIAQAASDASRNSTIATAAALALGTGGAAALNHHGAKSRAAAVDKAADAIAKDVPKANPHTKAGQNAVRRIASQIDALKQGGLLKDTLINRLHQRVGTIAGGSTLIGLSFATGMIADKLRSEGNEGGAAVLDAVALFERYAGTAAALESVASSLARSKRDVQSVAKVSEGSRIVDDAARSKPKRKARTAAKKADTAASARAIASAKAATPAPTAKPVVTQPRITAAVTSKAMAGASPAAVAVRTAPPAVPAQSTARAAIRAASQVKARGALGAVLMAVAAGTAVVAGRSGTAEASDRQPYTKANGEVTTGTPAQIAAWHAQRAH